MANGQVHGTPASREQRVQQTERGGKPHPARLGNPNGKDWTQRQGKPDPKTPKGGDQ